MSAVEDVCELIKDYSDRRYALFTGNATTAIYLSLCALPKKGKVIIPVNICPNPVNAILYAHMIPLFCDVDTNSNNMSSHSLKELLQNNKDVVAIILPHLYGMPCDLDEILDLAEKQNVTVIEDVAQALGSTYKGKRCGSFGQVSVLSFGSDKILGRYGGGALLTNNEDIYLKALTLEHQIPLKPIDFIDLQMSYRKNYYEVQHLKENGQDVDHIFATFPQKFKSMYLFKGETLMAKSILEKWNELQNEIEIRTESAFNYENFLDTNFFSKLTLSPDRQSSFWRYSICFKRERREFLRLVREKGIDISAWYPSVHTWYGCKARFPNGEFLSNQIINLWTLPTNKPLEIKKNCTILNQIASQLQPTK